MTDNAFAPPRSNVEVQEGPEELWAMTWKEVRKVYLASVNIRALGFLYGLGAFGVIVAGGMFMMAVAPYGGDAASAPSVGLGLFFVVLGVIYVAACVTSFTRPVWGRWLGIVLSVLGLLSFPLGTIIGIIALIAYAQGGRLFGPERIQHKDVALVYKQRKKDKQ